MTAPLAPATASPRPNRRWFRRLVISCVVVLLAAVAAGALKQGLAARQLQQTLDALRAQGEPTTFQELDDAYQQAATGPDLTEPWLAACAAIGGAMRQATKGNPSTAEFLRSQAENLSRLHELTEKPGTVRWPLEQAPETGAVSLVKTIDPQPHPAEADFSAAFAADPHDRESTRDCLLLAARFHVQNKDVAAAARALCTNFALAYTLDGAPTMIGLLERGNVISKTTEQLKDALPQGVFSSDDLQKLQAALSHESDTPNDLRWAMRGERVSGLAGLDLARSQGDWLYRLWYCRSEMLFYLQSMQELTDRLQLTLSVAREQSASSTIDERAQHTIVAGRLLPPSAALHESAYRGVAVARVALLAVALTRYQLDHGQPPAQLADLVPKYLAELPLDPQKQAPFTYEADSEQFVVYGAWQAYSIESRDSKTGLHKDTLYRSRFDRPAETKPE